MNNIVANSSKDIFNIEIPSFDSGAITTQAVAPEKNVSNSEFAVIANKSFLSFGIMLLCILIFLIFVFLYKKKQTPQISNIQTLERKKTSFEKEKIEQVRDRYDFQQNESSSQRYNSKKRSSLSTPTSINKCIKAFLENTREN